MTRKFNTVYSCIFSILVLVLLFSFLPFSNITVAAITNDFRWRRNLIAMYSSFRLNVGDRVYDDMIVGKKGWLFYTGDGSIDDYQKTKIFRVKRLADLQKELDRLNSDLEKKGATLLVVIPPNKSTIYSQYMPVEIPVLGRKSQLDQFIEYMNLHGDTFILDLRKTLMDGSRFQPLYYKTDTHWNDIGAYYGYKEIMHVLALKYSSLRPHPITDYKYVVKPDSVRDIPLLLGLSNYKEEDRAMVPNFKIQLEEVKKALPDGRYIRTITNVDKQLPRLLVFGDSFYSSLSQFIEPHFSRVETIPFTYENGVWSLDWIQRENPDIVIIEIVERYIDVTLPMLFEN